MTEGQGKTKRTGSVVGSIASVDSKSKPRSFPLWSEYNESDINAEKWEGGVRGKEKGKSPNLQFFDDPEGRIEFPASIKVDHWKRTQDFIAPKVPVIVENENFIDLIHPNEHLCHSQLLRTIVSQIMVLWDISRTKPSKPENVEVTPWMPWEHIYSLCKAGKGHVPLYNQFGKYVVRLFWMGVWRKIVVDDLMPFDVNGKLLLPATTCDYELWPLLLSKALIKIAAIDYNVVSDVPEIGDFFVIQCLTGWIPETIPLQLSHNKNVWELMKKALPEWTLPNIEEKEKPPNAAGDKDLGAVSAASAKPNDHHGHGKADNGGGSKAEKPDKGSGKETKGGKESSRKREEKEKSKSRPHTPRPASARSGTDKSVADEPLPTRPEDVQIFMFATFSQDHGSPAPITLLRDMAKSSEQLRKVGLSHLHTHPIFISQTRSCSLIPPVPVPEIPRWKRIRPHRRKPPPSDEPQPEPAPPKPDQWLEIISPFIGYRPPLNVIDKPVPISASGASLVLNEADEEEEEEKLPAKSLKPKPPSTKSHRNADASPNRKNVTLENQPSQLLVSPAAHNKDSVDDLSTRLDEEEETHPEEDGETLIPAADEDLLKKSWIDFDEFCKSFSNVVIFHKTNTYPHHETACEFKQAVLNAGAPPPQHGGKKGSAQANTVGSTTNVSKPSQSPVVPKSYEGLSFEERTPGFLFVDNARETELIISYSVVPRWFGLEDKRISDRESVAGVSEAISYKQDPPHIPSGLLVVEQHTWKSLVTGQPVLRIRTTGTKAACLTLPAGRHVLRFVYNSPLGYHVQICSSTKFIFGDEDSVMLPLKDESCRFTEAADHLMNCVDKCLETFGHEEEFKVASLNLRKAHMPYSAESKLEMINHYQSWHSAFYATVSAALGDDKLSDISFGLRAFLLDLQPECLALATTESTKDTAENWTDRVATEEEHSAAELIQRNWRGSYTRKVVKARSLMESTEQKSALGALQTVRSALHANQHAYALMLLRNLLKYNSNLLPKFSFYKDEWNCISYTDYLGTFSEQQPRTWFVVFREILYVEQDTLCVPKLYVPIPTCTLRVINNDTGEEVKRVFQKVAPQIYKKNKRGYTFVAEARTLDHPLTPGKWKLRLIGSTYPLPSPTNSQLASVFAVKEIKDYYIPNKSHILLRYTVKCNINVVGSLQLQTSKPDAVIQFKIYDNDVELATAKGKGHCVIPAFYFLTNNRERVASGNSINDSKAAATTTNSTAQGKGGAGGGKKVTLSGKKGDGKTSPLPVQKDKKPEAIENVPQEDDDNTYAHNYVIEAKVERKTWPLSRSQWAYVEKLKEVEKEELKAFSEEKCCLDQRHSLAVHPRRGRYLDGGKSPTLKRSPNRKSASSPRPNPLSNPNNKPRSPYSGGQRQSMNQKQGATGDKGKKGSKGGAEKGKDKKEKGEISSRPSSQSILDESRAYWLLRFVVDAEVGDEVELKKDTHRQEEIRAMKQAWETAEPGRAVKAMQARLNYLSNNLVKAESSDKENEDEDEKLGERIDASSEPTADDMELLHSPPPSTSNKDLIKPLDASIYMRHLPDGVVSRYVSPEELALIDEEEQKRKTDDHNTVRNRTLIFKDQSRVERMALKEQQFEACHEMQYDMDKNRTELLKPREAYRQRLLDEKRMKDEAAEAAAAAALAASEAATPDPKRKSGKKKK